MVEVIFAGAWPEENQTRVLRCVQSVLRECLRLETDPAQFQLGVRPANTRGVTVCVQLFPAGSGRMRRAAAERLTQILVETEALSAAQIAVSFDTPQQERVPGCPELAGGNRT